MNQSLVCLEQHEGELIIFHFWLNCPYNAPMTSRHIHCISVHCIFPRLADLNMNFTTWAAEASAGLSVLLHTTYSSAPQSPFAAATWAMCGTEDYHIHCAVCYNISCSDLTSCLIQLSPVFISDINVIFWIKIQSGLTFAVNLSSEVRRSAFCVLGLHTALLNSETHTTMPLFQAYKDVVELVKVVR